MVLVDSSIWIEAARRDGDLKAKVGLECLLGEYEAVLCAPVRLEVLGGARKLERERLEHGFSCLPYLQVLDKDWLAAVFHAWKLRDVGIAVPWNDVLIATLAVRADMRVYAKDKHFESMAAILKLRLYEPGYGGTYKSE
jgi:predicted nucleic acid-binding protein